MQLSKLEISESLERRKSEHTGTRYHGTFQIRQVWSSSTRLELGLAEPHDLSLDCFEWLSADTHPVVDVTVASSKALYNCYSIADSDVD